MATGTVTNNNIGLSPAKRHRWTSLLCDIDRMPVAGAVATTRSDSTLRIGQQAVTATGMESPSIQGLQRTSDDLLLLSAGPANELEVCQHARQNVAAWPFTGSEKSAGLVKPLHPYSAGKFERRKREESDFVKDEPFKATHRSTRACSPRSRSQGILPSAVNVGSSFDGCRVRIGTGDGSLRTAVNAGSSFDGSRLVRVRPADTLDDNELPTAIRQRTRACSHSSRNCSQASLRSSTNARSSDDRSPMRASPVDDVKQRPRSVRKVVDRASAGPERNVSNIPRRWRSPLNPAAIRQAGSSLVQGGGRYLQASLQRAPIAQRSPPPRSGKVGNDPIKPVLMCVAGRPSAADPERIVHKGGKVKRYVFPPEGVDKPGVMGLAGRSSPGPERIVDKDKEHYVDKQVVTRLARRPSAGPERIFDQGKAKRSFQTTPEKRRYDVDKQVVMKVVSRPSVAAVDAERIADKGKVKRYLPPSEKHLDKEEEPEQEDLDFIDDSELPTAQIRKQENSSPHGKIRSPSQPSTFRKASTGFPTSHGGGYRCRSPRACDLLQIATSHWDDDKAQGTVNADSSCYGSQCNWELSVQRPMNVESSDNSRDGLDDHDHMDASDADDEQHLARRDPCAENKISSVARVLVFNTPTVLPSKSSGRPSNIIPDQASCYNQPGAHLSTNKTKSTYLAKNLPPKKRWGLQQAKMTAKTT